METVKYQSGFGNHFETEALEGALPVGRNSPQRCAYGLYAEQLSGSPFTAPRDTNERTWVYRIRPSVRHVSQFSPLELPAWVSAPDNTPATLPPAQLRWGPQPMPAEPVNFLTGMRTFTTAGDVRSQNGMAAHVYLINESMSDSYFFNADAEMLIVLQQGELIFDTEMGRIVADSGEIVVIPRGIKFRVALGTSDSDDGNNTPQASGYICENYGAKFELPERGPIGANCLANSRDFLTPIASFNGDDSKCTVTMKWCGKFYQCQINHSPLDVVAWHGNYVPYKYDLRRFSPVGALVYDHPDPSIFTVLTAPSETAGTANVDFVIFPERWAVAENTFRPPWYHMNIMSEFMGNVYGVYDAKPEGFKPGGISLHNCMLPHGPDADAFKKAVDAELSPVKLENTLAFMFETRLPQIVTKLAAESATLQTDYADCWSGLEKNFDGTPAGAQRNTNAP